MVLSIPKSEFDRLGFDLPAEIRRYAIARERHALSVNRPAPIADPLVEAIVLRHDGRFEVFDDAVPPSPDEIRAAILATILAEEAARLDAILSPARRELLAFDLARLRALPSPTSDEAGQLAGLAAQSDAIDAIKRRSLLLQIELEDLADDEVAGWSPLWGI